MEIELTILAANNIIAGDIGGTSDGYVKFETRKTKKMKTKIAPPTLNPVWNQKFNCIIEPNEEIKFEVYDHDLIGKDDNLGEARLIVPGMMTGEYWHDCLSISKRGYLYVSLYCKKGINGSTMHPFSPLADMVIRMEFNRLTHLGRCNGNPQVGKIIIKPPNQKEQISNVFTFNKSTKISETFIIKCKPGDKIEFKVEEPGLLSNTTIDKSSITIPDFKEGEKSEEHLPGKKGSTFDCKIQCIRSVYHNVFPQFIPQDNDFINENEMKFYLYFDKAEKIKAGDIGGTSDAYVKFKTSKSKEKKTYVFAPSVNPDWNQCFRIKGTLGEEIIFHLFDKDTLTSDDHLGDAKWKIDPLFNNQWKKFKLQIDKKGSLCIEVKRVKTLSLTYKRLLGLPVPSTQFQGYPQQQPYPYPQQYQYPPPQGYPQQPGQYPPQQSYPQYPPQGYPQYPPQGYPQQPGQYPPQQGYPQQPGQYPPQQGYPQYPPQAYHSQAAGALPKK
ncbi:synaptotagmin, putative [Entamoeba histolytica HM-3:IMSS]|uniref:C2 domain containing protein n=2 Tax=Entamoeba histolytica TaxID=5759 RepID=M2SF85_ENTHI|nr:C2 domain containing protein [Entamoeba histolytica KU27]EMS11301.1 synaptotagmin, putative [Entamoeba histolytica HM-3:IMSS]